MEADVDFILKWNPRRQDLAGWLAQAEAQGHWENVNVQAKAPVSRLNTGHVALDIDVFPMDNSKTHKEGVSRTYKGHDGYAPIAAYLGQEGWCLACDLRDGSMHCQNEFLYTLERVIPNAQRLTSAPAVGPTG